MNWEEFREDVNTALGSVKEKYKVGLDIKTIRYDAKTFRFTVEGVFLVGDKSSEQTVFDNNCFKYGLNKSDFNSILFIEGKRYKIVGINPKARKYPIIVEDDSGNKVKASTEVLKNKGRSNV